MATDVIGFLPKDGLVSRGCSWSPQWEGKHVNKWGFLEMGDPTNGGFAKDTPKSCPNIALSDHLSTAKRLVQVLPLNPTRPCEGPLLFLKTPLVEGAFMISDLLSGLLPCK